MLESAWLATRPTMVVVHCSSGRAATFDLLRRWSSPSVDPTPERQRHLSQECPALPLCVEETMASFRAQLSRNEETALRRIAGSADPGELREADAKRLVTLGLVADDDGK